MYKVLRSVVVVVIMASLMFAGCGKGSDPKSLAKQMFEIYQKTTAAMQKGDQKQVDKLTAEDAKLKEKVAKLSPADMQIANDEYVRLLQSAGVDTDALSGEMAEEEGFEE
jgi:hypothetical protein